MTKKTKKRIVIIVYILAVIGIFTVIDNSIRLTKEVSNTLKNHKWNMVVID